MAGHQPWKKLIDKMSPEKRREFEQAAKAQRIGRLLAHLRKHSGLTQAELAERLGIAQPNLSRLESAEDMHFDTLKRIVAELGGEIRIHVPGGEIPISSPSAT